MYTADDFNTENAPKEMVQYVIDNIDGFDSLYQYANRNMGIMRCNFRYASPLLYEKIASLIDDWCWWKDIENTFDIEEIFG
jgi:hypothetical protein